MACKQCGDCCTYVALEVTDDAARWLEMHGIPLKSENGKHKVIFHAACRHYNPETRLCRIHQDQRPQICQDYLCDKARGTEMLTKEDLLKRKGELQADLNAIAGALQQIDWTLAQMDEPDNDTAMEDEREWDDISAELAEERMEE